MSNVTRLDRSAHDIDAATQSAKEAGLTSGVLVGFTEDGKLFYSGFGGSSNERTLFMFEAVKHSIFSGD